MGGRISIMPGGGLTEENVELVVSVTGEEKGSVRNWGWEQGVCRGACAAVQLVITSRMAVGGGCSGWNVP